LKITYHIFSFKFSTKNGAGILFALFIQEELRSPIQSKAGLVDHFHIILYRSEPKRRKEKEPIARGKEDDWFS
jgi:hypothetical protein